MSKLATPLTLAVDATLRAGKVKSVNQDDADGHCYNVEIQVRKYGSWHKRGLFYLARTLSNQLDAGQDYQHIGASIGLHLLDFDLFDRSDAERQQAVWRFEMRDETQPNVTLGNILQMNLIELNKADRLGLNSSPLATWITFFKHWQEELIMTDVTYEPVKKALNRVKELSANEEARRLAFVRERALRDEVSYINEAKREGLKEGHNEGRTETQRETALKLINMNILTDEQISEATGLSLVEIADLRSL